MFAFLIAAGAVFLAVAVSAAINLAGPSQLALRLDDERGRRSVARADAGPPTPRPQLNGLVSHLA